eukprot:scaffold33_cov135-Pinguiococcus_pyrenoidosus.AAC.12
MHKHPEDNGRTVLPDEEIEIELRAPNVPTIDLVDIPGIVQYPPAAAKATREIATRYLRMEHTLVLCVLSARTQSLRNNAVWPLLRETLEGDRVSRVIAVLTMVDLPGGDDMLAERMSLRGDVPDDVGIERLVPVVNRDTNTSVGMGEATEIERRWLQGWCERRGAGEPELEYDPSKLGIHAVLQQITNLFVKSNHIRTQ